MSTALVPARPPLDSAASQLSMVPYSTAQASLAPFALPPSSFAPTSDGAFLTEAELEEARTRAAMHELAQEWKRRRALAQTETALSLQGDADLTAAQTSAAMMRSVAQDWKRRQQAAASSQQQSNALVISEQELASLVSDIGRQLAVAMRGGETAQSTDFSFKPPRLAGQVGAPTRLHWANGLFPAPGDKGVPMSAEPSVQLTFVLKAPGASSCHSCGRSLVSSPSLSSGAFARGMPSRLSSIY